MTNSVNGVQANAGTFQYNPYMYDFDDLDMSYSTYPIGGMGSIFDGYNIGMGMGAPMPIAGVGGNNQSYFDNMRDYQKFYVDYNVDQQRMNRNAELRINASLEKIKGAATILKDKIVNNEQGQIEQAYKNYVAAVAQAYGAADKGEIEARAKTLYAQMNNGKSIVDELREHGHSSMTSGFLQSLMFSTYNRKSAEDNISEITGAPVNTSEKLSQNVGRVAGAATAGAVAGGLVKLCQTGSKAAKTTTQVATNASKFSKFFKGKAGIIGLAVAGVAAALSFITGKVTT